MNLLEPVWALLPRAPGLPFAKAGGLPEPVGPLAWPACARCGQPMRFLFQLPHVDGRIELSPFAAVYVFQCENRASVCPRWDPEAGANRAIGVLAGAPGISGPASGLAPYPEHRLALEQTSEDADGLRIDVNAATKEQLQRLDRALEASPPSKVGGVPAWLQPPASLRCGQDPAALVAQLDCEPFGFDFGDGGRGYLSRCRGSCAQPFRFLVQSA